MWCIHQYWIHYYKLNLGKFWVCGSPFIWIDQSFFASLHLVPWHNYSKTIHLGINKKFNMVRQCSQFFEKQLFLKMLATCVHLVYV
jgi:hypothetical protein